MKARRFTGERLHAGDELFAVDLARHRAAYVYARAQIRAGRVLDLGSGSGHGTSELEGTGAGVVGVDRVAPDATSRSTAENTCFTRIGCLPVIRRRSSIKTSAQASTRTC